MNEYSCKKINSNIVIDGNIDKPEWNNAYEVYLVDTVTGQSPKQATSIKLLWNNEYLYVAFKCVDSYINAAMTGYNEKIYNEEVVEIFIDDDCDMKTYLEFEVNPLNASLHYAIYNNLSGLFTGYARVEKSISTAVHRDDEAGIWSAELAIPMMEFITAPNTPPLPGDKWRFNLYRIDRPHDGDDEYSAWQPTGALRFHTPEAFGTLVFE